MSKWTEIRDSIVEALQVEEVGQDLKTRFVDWLGDEGIGFIQPIADAIVDECKKDAPNESGWCKIRDAVVIPYGIQALVWLGKYVIDRTIKETEKVQ